MRWITLSSFKTTPIPQHSNFSVSFNCFKLNIFAKTSKLIQSTPSASKKDSLYNNYYDTSLEILLGKTKRDALYAQIQKQLKNGIFKAEQGISFRRIAHSLTMSNVYEGKSIIQKAVYSQQKLTPAEQAAFTGHILEIGARGEKLQKKFNRK